jgi:hypothetical protein
VRASAPTSTPSQGGRSSRSRSAPPPTAIAPASPPREGGPA